MAEKERFELSRRFPDKRISSAPRYDHFDTSPRLQYVICFRYGQMLFNYRGSSVLRQDIQISSDKASDCITF